MITTISFLSLSGHTSQNVHSESMENLLSPTATIILYSIMTEAHSCAKKEKTIYQIIYLYV